MTTARLANSSSVSGAIFGIPLLPFLFGASFLFFYFLADPLFRDYDTSWHIVNGNVYRATHHILGPELWSYTSAGEKVYPYTWLWDVIISVVVSVSGLGGLFVFSCLWLAGCLTLLGHILVSQRGVPAVPTMLSLLMAAIVLLAFPGARGQEFTLFGMISTMAILHRSRAHFSPKLYYLLPLFVMLWANMHGGYFTIFTILGAYGLEAMGDKNALWLRQLLRVSTLCLIATWFTPLGFGSWYYIFLSLTTVMNHYTIEWQSYKTGFSPYFDIPLITLLLASNFRNQNVPKADRILALLWTLMALTSIRNFAIAGLVSAPLLAGSLAELLPRKLRDYGKSAPAWKPAQGWACVALLCLACGFLPIRESITVEDRVIDKLNTPVDSIAFLRAHYPDVRFYNSYALGGYMMYYGGKPHELFIDSRGQAAYSEDTIQNAMWPLSNVMTDVIVRQYGIQGWFLKNTESRNLIPTLANDARWKLVYRDAVAAIFVRTDLASFRDPSAIPTTQTPTVRTSRAAPAKAAR